MTTETPQNCRAFWIERPGAGALRAAPLAAPGEGEVRVQALFSAISRGTETLVFRGEVPPSLHRSMRAPFQEGDFPGPVKYGYSLVGEVEEGPPDLLGRPVFCLHPHQDHLVVPADAVTPLPEAVPMGRAVLAANMETALNALWDAAPRLGDRITVIGAGAVGCLAAYLCARIPGVRTQLVDIDPAKQAPAERIGVPLCAPSEAEPEQDLVIHASGTASGLNSALELAGFEATVLELSWYGSQAVATRLGEGFHPKRLTLRSSQVGHVAEARRARRSTRDRIALALELLADPVLDALITGESRFTELPQTMARLAADPGGEICHRIVYD
ncbi:MAG: zinc-binding alcohol dehydrogenase [Alphaproteobacteria bacterium]|nr:zinc-binding alcohol dehydrogenase [Alphaproteobacteria bacterium]